MARDVFPPVWLREQCSTFWQRTAAASQRVWRTAAPTGSRGLRIVKDASRKTLERLRAISWPTLARRYEPLLIVVGVLLLLASPFVLWKLPQWYAASWDKLTDPKDIAKLESDTRTAMVQALGGIALLTGLWFTWRNLRLTEQNSRQTLDLSRKGQINDRFIKAIEQLGAVDQGGGKKLESRLGGIYALEQIARDSPDDYHWPIMEILTAYVRENASWKEAKQPSQEDIVPSETQPAQSNQSPPKLATDIQAILTVLGRRTRTHGKGEYRRLDLAHTNLQEAHLQDAHLEGVLLAGAHLDGAFLFEAHLERADLRAAHLKRAYLTYAHLEGADLRATHLEKAWLMGAHLERAHLEDAHLQKAHLHDVHLQRAYLLKAHLAGAHLANAHLEGADLVSAHLEGADLEDAHLDGANLKRAHLKGAIDLTVEQLSTVKTLYEADLDPQLREQIQRQYPHLLKAPQDDDF